MKASKMYARMIGSVVETSYSKNFTNGIVCYSSKGGFENWLRAAENTTDSKINVEWL